MSANALRSSKETSRNIIQTLLSLVSFPEGARIFASLEVDDWIPLIEIAPEEPHVLSIFIWAWERGATALTAEDSRVSMRSKIDTSIQSLVASFTGTDGTGLLEFIAHLGNLDAEVSDTRSQSFSKMTNKSTSLYPRAPGGSLLS